ncbi:hypothetical protein B0J12DRAFT_290185 [Macrophomina phaseolina]|uniref:Uncharacterized protein n=1 Tax=Macrophomina phaseolina TaxID=35725 RepID=A0ABQ8GNH6_9PEZI|nr:hypothetical protein B0J12DRAFT_290185 [Macrophomina phaseolina]
MTFKRRTSRGRLPLQGSGRGDMQTMLSGRVGDPCMGRWCSTEGLASSRKLCCLHGRLLHHTERRGCRWVRGSCFYVVECAMHLGRRALMRWGAVCGAKGGSSLEQACRLTDGSGARRGAQMAARGKGADDTAIRVSLSRQRCGERCPPRPAPRGDMASSTCRGQQGHQSWPAAHDRAGVRTAADVMGAEQRHPSRRSDVRGAQGDTRAARAPRRWRAPREASIVRSLKGQLVVVAELVRPERALVEACVRERVGPSAHASALSSPTAPRAVREKAHALLLPSSPPSVYPSSVGRQHGQRTRSAGASTMTEPLSVIASCAPPPWTSAWLSRYAHHDLQNAVRKASQSRPNTPPARRPAMQRPEAECVSCLETAAIEACS